MILRTSSNRRAVLNNRRKGGAGPQEKQGSAAPKRGALPQEDRGRERASSNRHAILDIGEAGENMSNISNASILIADRFKIRPKIFMISV